VSPSALKYTLLFCLLLSPVLIFTLLSLRSIELEAQESAERRKDIVVKRVEESISAFKRQLSQKIGRLVELAVSRDYRNLELHREEWEVYVFDRDFRLEFPVLKPCPSLDGPLPEKELQTLLRSWIRPKDSGFARKTFARLFWTSGSPRIQAASLLRLAVLSIAEGDLEGALHPLRLIGDRYPGARDVTLLPLGPAAAVELARTVNRMDQKGEATRILLEQLSDLVYGRYPITVAESDYFTGECRTLAEEVCRDPRVRSVDRGALARLLASPFPRLYQRYRAGGGMREVEGRLEHFGGKEYIRSARRTGQRVILVLAPSDEVGRLFSRVLGSPVEEGYRVFHGSEIPKPVEERFSSVMHLEVPYLGSTVTIGADRDLLVSLTRTRKTFLSGVVSLGLSMFFVGGFLIVRDFRRQLELARLKAEFIANVSHELKTPLTTIRMFAETLFHGRCRRDRERDYLKKILTESDHLTLLIENVLQLSRAEDVVVDGRRSFCDLKQIAEDAVTRLKVRWDDRNVQMDIPSGVTIECDGNLVTLALANLLDNAAKYGDARQSIRLGGGADRSGVFLSVADRGRGIPAADQARIFQRFYRASNSVDSSGMGLGLFLVQRIAQLHNGRIEFSSQEGVGSTFVMRLPGPTKSRPQTPSKKETGSS